MAIREIDGRNRSVRTDEERARFVEDLVRGLTPEELETLELMLSQQDESLLNSVVEAEYEREPVDPVQFIEDPYYLGDAITMYPVLKQDFADLFEGGFSTAILGGSIGYGKSFFSVCGLLYMIYQISCLRSPQQTYGLSPGTQIEVILVSVTKDTVRKRLLPEFTSKMEASPFFKNDLGFKPVFSSVEIRFARKNILLSGGSSLSVSIGGNVIGGLIDEISYLGNSKGVDRDGLLVAMDKAKVIATNLERRIEQRFQVLGKVPGVLFQVSSKERPNAYVENRITEAREANDPTVFIREYAGWDVKPRSDFSQETFKVAVGSARLRSVLDPTPEDVQRYLDEGLKVIDVPVNFRHDFERNLEGSIRDIAGVETSSVSVYINRPDRIVAAVCEDLHQPIPSDEIYADRPLGVDWSMIARSMIVDLKMGGREVRWFPTRHPDEIRMGHIDLGLVGDAAGVAIAHISDWIYVVRRDHRSVEFQEYAPVIDVDLLLRVKPPPGDEINFGEMRGIIYQYAEHGFQFGFVGYDSWQSIDSQQQFRENGIESGTVSIDRTTEKYDTLKMALYEGRLRLPVPCGIVVSELQELRRVITRHQNGLTVKVGHPEVNSKGEKGTKDVADALAGVVWKLTQVRPVKAVMPILGRRLGDPRQEPVNVIGGSPNSPAPGNLPFIRGGRL